MMKPSGKRLFSLLLAIFMVITMLPPNIVFAEDDIPMEEPSTPVCTGLEDCAAEIHEDGCPKKPAAEPVEDEEPTKPACTGLADCPAETHGEACEKKLADEKAAADKAAADAVAATKNKKPKENRIEPFLIFFFFCFIFFIIEQSSLCTLLQNSLTTIVSATRKFYDSFPSV